MVLENRYTKKLKAGLHSKWTILIFLTICSIYLIGTLTIKNTKETQNQMITFEGIIKEYEWKKENEVELIIQGKKEKYLIKIKTIEKEKIESIIQYGNKIKGTGTKKLPLNNTIPNQFNYKKYLKSQRIYYWVETSNIQLEKKANFLYRLKQRIRENLESRKNKGYYKMLILGIKDETIEKVMEQYRKNGISHVFAISGLHLIGIYKLFAKIIKKIFKSKKTDLVLPFIILSFYNTLIFKSISSQRAYCFLLLNTLNKLFNLELSNKKIFLYNLGIAILKNPYSIYQISFWYSYIVSFTLIFFSISKKKKYASLKNGLLIFAVTIPITINSSYEINPWTIMNNIMMVPIITGILFPILIITTIFPILEPLENIIIIGVEYMNTLLSNLVLSEIGMRKIPEIILGLYYLLLYGYVLLRKNKILIYLLILVIFYIITPKLNPYGYIYFLDVGQGDSALIISPYQKETILIDTGMENKYNLENVLKFIKSLGLNHIDYMILSHGDEDHIGNALGLLKEFEVNRIILNNGAKNIYEKSIEHQYSYKMSTEMTLNQIKVKELIHQLSEEENDDSRILNICLYQTCTLFMGDASTKVEEELIKKYQIKSEIVKIGHHGSKNSTSNTFLKQTNFQDAIISAGRNNIYHHPHSIVLKHLKENHINIWNTQEKGTIKVRINKKGYTIASTSP